MYSKGILFYRCKLLQVMHVENTKEGFLLPRRAVVLRCYTRATESCKHYFVYRLWDELSQAMQRPGCDRVQEKTQNFSCRQQPNICSCFKPLPSRS